MQKGEKIVYEKIKQSDYWWCGIYEDFKNFIYNCEIFHKWHKKKSEKPQIKQIIKKALEKDI